MTFYLIYAAILVASLFAVWRLPALAISIFICNQVLDFWGQMSSPLVAENPQFTNVAVALLVVLGVIRKLISNSLGTISFGWVTSLVLMLWVFAFLSISWSPVPTVAYEQWSLYWPYMLIVFLLCPLLVSGIGDLRIGLIGLLVLGTTLCVLVDLFVSWEDRFVVSFWNPNVKFWNALAFAQMAGYVGIAACLLKWNKSRVFFLLRLISIGAALLLAAKSGSRGQFGLMILIPVVLLPLSQSKRNWRQHLAVIGLIVAFCSMSFFIFSYFSVDQDRWGRERFDADVEGRLDMAKKVISVWWSASERDSMTFLIGLGNSASFSTDIVGFYPHLVPAEVLAEEGVIGALMLTSLFFLALQIGLKGIRLTVGSPEQRGVVSALFGMFLFAFLLSLKQGSLVNSSAQIFLFLILLDRAVRMLTRENMKKAVSESTTLSRRYKNLLGAG